MSNITVIQKNVKCVNTKSLFAHVTQYVESAITAVGVKVASNDLHREVFVELIEDFLEAEKQSRKIDVYKVIFDVRNNTVENMQKGIYNLTIQYQQRNCLNTTEFTYEIASSNETLPTIDFEI